MFRKLTVALLGVAAALGLALAFAAPASSTHSKDDAMGCKLIYIGGKPKTICQLP